MLNMPALSGKLYRVKVPLLATLTPIDYKFGIRLNTYTDEFGRSGNDKNKNKEWSIVLLKLDKIIEIYEQGFPIRMLNRDDITKLYNELDKYVQDMANMCNRSINAQALFDKRVYVIERFVNEIVGNNKGTILRNMFNAKLLHQGVVDIPIISSYDMQKNMNNVTLPKVVKPINNNPFDHPTPQQRREAIGGENLSNNKIPVADPYANIYDTIPKYTPRFFNPSFN